MKEITKTVINMEKEFILGQVAIDLKENTKMVINMEGEFILCQMALG